VNGEGRLEVRTPAGGFADDRPVGYQGVNGDRVDVALRYLLEERSAIKPGPSGEEAVTKSYVYGFEVGDYDRTKPLVLDPAVLVYCGYIGGSGYDCGQGIAVDGSGNAFVTGYTSSTEATFPVIGGPDLTYKGGTWDAFVAKVNASGTALVYCGYIGGSGDDYGYGIAVDGSGNAYVTGQTDSAQATFPVVVGPGLTHNGITDAFAAKVNASGTALSYCGYIGGNSDDYGYGIAVDGSGNAYVTGRTESTQATFPVTGGPDLTYGGGLYDAFVAKVKANPNDPVVKNNFDYCGYIGGLGGDEGYGISVDGSGNAYVTGATVSFEATFPVIGGPDLTHNGAVDAFVAKVNASGTALSYCGYIGGSGDDYGHDVAVDSTGNAYVTGQAHSTQATFPEIGGPDLTYNGGGYDAFVAKVNSSGAALVYCGYIGGSDYDDGRGIAVDSSGNAYVTGRTGSTEATFPVVVGPDLTYGGDLYDAFVAKVNSTGTTLLYCGYIGGAGIEGGRSIAVDDSGNAYVTGHTSSTQATFPVAVGPDLTHNVSADAFVAKISSIPKDDFLGTWDGQGVYYLNSDTGLWVKLASPADLITAGDLDGDGIDDLIGIWPAQGGVWVKYSATGSWAKLSTTAEHIAAGDMNGDGRCDLLGTWDSQGVYYRNSLNGFWVQMASPADLITAGDLDGDGIDDLIGIWPAQGGVWVKYSATGSWAWLSSTAKDIAAGDMNGDGRVDFLGTWDGQGVFYRDSVSSAWVKMATPADQVTCGYLDGDAKADLIGIWPTQGGGWVKYSATSSWAKLSSSAGDIAAGKMRAGTGGSMPAQALYGPMGGYAQGPENLIQYQDISSEGPGGLRFVYQTEELLIPQEHESEMMRIPGPGEPGFRCVEEENLIPEESRESGATKEDRERNTK